jgi:hypothetical protein
MPSRPANRVDASGHALKFTTFAVSSLRTHARPPLRSLTESSPLARQPSPSASSSAYPVQSYAQEAACLTLPLAHSAKNVAASFAKQDSQSHVARRLPDAERDAVREAKRRRLMASEEELEAARAREGDATGRIEVNVLASAPEGAVRRRRARELGATQGREVRCFAERSSTPR